MLHGSPKAIETFFARPALCYMAHEWRNFVPAQRHAVLARIGVVHFVGFAKSHVFRHSKKKVRTGDTPLMVYQILRLLYVVCLYLCPRISIILPPPLFFFLLHLVLYIGRGNSTWRGTASISNTVRFLGFLSILSFLSSLVSLVPFVSLVSLVSLVSPSFSPVSRSLCIHFLILINQDMVRTIISS